MSKMLENYEAALQRLIINKPTNQHFIKKIYKINKANVAIEAGRDPSSIKNSNPEFLELRKKIKLAEIARRSLNNLPLQKDLKTIVNKKNDQYDSLKELYEIQLMQINSLIVENKRLRDKIKTMEIRDNLLFLK